MRLPKDYAAPKQEQAAVEYIWEQKGCVQQRREPIVRCKDCKHYDEAINSCDWWSAYERLAEPDGFCAWGERKADA